MHNFSKNLSDDSTDDTGADFYHGYFELRPPLIMFATYSAILTPIAVSILYSIIWYEHNGSDSRRTLVNRLVSPICLVCIIFFAVPQTIDFFRYLYGPYSHRLCYFNLYIKNVLTVMNMLFFTFIAISKYVSIFVLKNPLVYLDDFWSRFICLWVFFGSNIIQFVLDFLPGKHPLNYFVCTGKNPALDPNKETRIIRNYSMFAGCIIVITVTLFVCIKVSLFKQKLSTPGQYNIQVLDKKLLTGDLIQISNGLFLIFHLLLLLKIQSLNMTQMDIYPNYLYLYYLHLLLLPNFSLMITTLYYARNRPLREMVFRELRYRLTGHIDVTDPAQECYNLSV